MAAQTVNTLCDRSGIDKSEIAAVGWHGQTCGHFPPSIAAGQPPYTLQIFDPARLADLTGLPVIYDFRSDDLMNGGEAAPLAPVHNRHIAADLREKGAFPVAFCNAGNTGNIAVISETDDRRDVTQGWDIGPFNHFADMLVRMAKSEPCDLDGRYGRQGQIVPELLSELFDTAAVTNEGKNFYLQPPPKSSDPCWYRLDLQDAQKEYGFKNTLRTIEYLSAYTFLYTLSFIPENVRMPHTFLLFGGGWKILSFWKISKNCSKETDWFWTAIRRCSNKSGRGFPSRLKLIFRINTVTAALIWKRVFSLIWRSAALPQNRSAFLKLPGAKRRLSPAFMFCRKQRKNISVDPFNGSVSDGRTD